MIKKILFYLSGIVIAQLSYGQIDRIKSLYEYELIPSLSDEFNGSSLDGNKWEDFDRSVSRYNTSIDNYPEVYASPACLKVEPGSDGMNVLKLIAKNETITATHNGWGPTDPTTFFYQMGSAVSKTLFYHGYYEIRAKIPNTRNTNGAAFWFWDRDTDIPSKYSEVDVFENQPMFRYRCPTATHYSTLPNSGYEYSLQNCSNVPFDITDGWHTYGVEWTPDAITFYLDGLIVNKVTTIPKSGNSGSTSVSSLRKMRALLWNKANFGAEASINGDVMEVDYFRYYKRKPSINFVSYDSGTGRYTYAAHTKTPTDQITWSYKNGTLTSVATYQIAGVNFITFIPLSASGITATANQTLQLQGGLTQNVSASSSITVATDNPYFYARDPSFYNGTTWISAYSVSTTPNGIWTIGLKNANGTIDWSAPQTQTGTEATFGNLLSGRTYVIKHQKPAAGSYLNTSESTKEINVLYDSKFYVDKIQTINGSTNTVQLVTYAASSNPDSEWHIWLLNPDGSVNTSVDQPQWGLIGTFNNLLPGRTYQVTHGNYGPNQAWVSSTQFIPVDFESNFEFYNPYLYNCAGHDPIICYFQGAYRLEVGARGIDPVITSINANQSEFYIYELDANGDHLETDPLAAPIITGTSGFFPIQLNKNYLIRHVVHAPNGYVAETRKTVRTQPHFVNCSANFPINPETSEEVPFESVALTDSILQIDTNREDWVQIFPNPTSGELYIRQSNHMYQKVSILDPLGRVIISNLSLEKESINISQLPTGTYILELDSLEKGVKKVKIIKQ